jgi:hypothetical protein
MPKTNRYLTEQARTTDLDRNYGYWLPPGGVKVTSKVGAAAVPHVVAADEFKDTALWPLLFKAFPDWRHGLQGTGDCVSWMTKHNLDTLMAVQVFQKKLPQEIVAPVRQEAVYGFGRVELYGRPDHGGAGMYGGAAADAIVKFGTLHAMEYIDMASRNYDLRKYSGKRAVSWGRTGVPDGLEPTAKGHRAKDKLVVTNAELAGQLIQQGYPVGYCGQSTWGITRGSDGIATRFSSGAHAMSITGVRYQGSEPLCFWVANTGHGDHVTGSVGPIDVPAIYAECGSWMPVDRIERVLRAGDCYAQSVYEGFPLSEIPLDWGTGAFL